MRHLSIRGRLAIILVAFLIPIIVLGYNLNHQLTKAIHITKLEMMGLDYEKPLLDLTNEVMDYQVVMLRHEMGDKEAAKELEEGNTKIEALLKELEDKYNEYGDVLDMTPEGMAKHNQKILLPSELKSLWQDIRTGSYNVDEFKKMIDNLQAIIKALGNNSTMILDPEMDTYSLVNTMINDLPQILQQVGNAKVDNFILLSKNNHTIPENKRGSLMVLISEMQDFSLPAINNDIATAIREDANSNGSSPTLKNLNPALEKYNGYAADSLKMMESLENGATLDANKFIENLDVLHDGTAELGNLVRPELQKLFEIRHGELTKSKRIILGSSFAIVFLTLIGFYIISGSISNPIKNMTQAMHQLAAGNLEVDIPSSDSRSEIGVMAKAVLVFKNNMRETERLKQEQEAQKVRAEEEKRAMMHQMATNFERDVKSVVNMVAAAATELSQTADGMSNSAQQSKVMVGEATMASEQTTSNVQSVASATEELSASVREISAQLQKTNNLVQLSSEKTANADQLATELNTASDKVNDVMELIADIASKINLLALNATIESARAGEAGRGFAVVASEVKNLASQTDKSIAEIQVVVGEMRNASIAIVQALTDIKNSITEISAATSNVASAVEEQSATTNEISRNMQNAAGSTQLVSGNLAQVSNSSAEAASSSEQMAAASKELSKQAEILNGQVDAFLTKVRSS